jgi:tRNA(Ile2) C34 agmatinyltransferase TiaS
MLDGVDAECDAMGLLRHEEFVCGDCRHSMIPIGNNRYQCPHCGMVFEDTFPEDTNSDVS